MPGTIVKHSAEGRELRTDVSVPDPSVLTTQQMRHKPGTSRAAVEARLDGMDSATRLLTEHVDRTPTDIDKAVLHLTDSFDERMESLKAELVSLQKDIQLQFDKRDIRSHAPADAGKVAVDAALHAQRETAAQNESNPTGVTKSERAADKQLDGIAVLLGSNTMAINDKIADIPSRLDRGETIMTTNAPVRQDRRLDGGANVGILVVTLTAIMAMIGLIGFVAMHLAGPSASVPKAGPPSSSATLRP